MYASTQAALTHAHTSNDLQYDRSHTMGKQASLICFAIASLRFFSRSDFRILVQVRFQLLSASSLAIHQ